MFMYLKLLVGSFGLFTLWCWACWLSGTSFQYFYWLSGFPLVVGAALVALQCPLTTRLTITEASPQGFKLRWRTVLPALLLILLALVLTVLGVESGFTWSWVAWALGTLWLCISIRPVGRLESPHPVGGSTSQQNPNILLILLGFLLVTIYLLSTRTSADDTHFVAAIVGLLEHPGLPLFSTDSIFKAGAPNYIFMLNTGQSIEALSAVLASLFSLDHLYVYYVIVPVIFLFAVPAVTYYFVKAYSARYALFGSLFALVFLVIWSVYNHLHGMFFMPRFYQGKGVMLMVFLPLVFLFSREFFAKPSLASAVWLGLTLVAAAGASSTGLYIALLCLGMGYLAFCPLNVKRLLLGGSLVLLLALPNMLMGIIVKSDIQWLEQESPVTQSLVSNGEPIPDFKMVEPEYRPTSSMYWLFGDRFYLAVMMLIITAGLLASRYIPASRMQEASRFFLVCILLGFSHLVAELMSRYVGPANVIWRFHWIIPLPLVLALSFALLMELAAALPGLLPGIRMFSHPRINQWGLSLSLSAAFIVLGILGWPVLQSSYGLTLQWLKVDQDAMAVARNVATKLTDQSQVLAAENVAQTLPMLQHQGQLVTSRALYWQKPYFAPEETRKRQFMQYVINTPNPLDETELQSFDSLLNEKGVTDVVLTKEKSNWQLLMNRLQPVYACNNTGKNYIHCAKN